MRTQVVRLSIAMPAPENGTAMSVGYYVLDVVAISQKSYAAFLSPFFFLALLDLD